MHPSRRKELEKLAKTAGETVSFLIQQAVREYLERKTAMKVGQ